MEVDTCAAASTTCRSAAPSCRAGRRRRLRRQRPRRVTPARRRDEVLLVEDSPIARQFLKQRLQHLGYRVIECASGEAALELLSRRTFEMVFLDVVLGPPGSIDGLQLCQRLKQQWRAARRPAHGGGDGHRAGRRRRPRCAARWPAAMPTSPSRCTRASSSPRCCRSIRPSSGRPTRPPPPDHHVRPRRRAWTAKAAARIRAPPPSNWPSRVATAERERRGRGEQDLGEHHHRGHVGRARRAVLQREVAGQEQQRHRRHASPNGRGRRRRRHHAAAGQGGASAPANVMPPRTSPARAPPRADAPRGAASRC